ncbi:SH3 domain-containing protein [Streptomyces fagopyri]|uniref:SH3 domain-containing protein n=1 Tax=Streptomyces fagopyri TaxID=2662397 RepID=UPI003816E7ED
MRRIPAAVAICAAALAFLAPAGTATAAQAARAEQSYTVVPYENVDVRQSPTGDSAYPATLTWDIGAGFVDVVFLQGDDHAGLPGPPRC